MILEHEKAKIPDENGKHDLILEVNWKPDDPDTNECKIIRVTYPDGTQAFIRRDYLHTFLFAISKTDEQRDLIPHKVKTTRKYSTLVGVVAKNNIKKGEKVNFVVDIPLPDIEKEIMAQAKKEINKTGKIVVPT